MPDLIPAIADLVSRHRSDAAAVTANRPEPPLVEFLEVERLTPDNAAHWATKYIKTIPDLPSNFTGRGIVICAGGVRYFTNAWVTIRLLRHLGCELPIQVWYRGATEEDPQWADLAMTWDVQSVDATTIPGCITPRGGWELKSFAMLHCPYEEVLLLDADNAPVLDPTYLFDTPEYRQTGAVFWPDLLRTGPGSVRWQIFGVPYRTEQEQESGQVLVDKRRCWRELCLCNAYNERSDFFYRYVYGDKDTFRFAWHRLGTPFTMPQQHIERIPHTLCQHDPSGRRVFQHRVHDKWSLAGNRRIPGFVHEEPCLEFIDELKARWQPVTQLARAATRDDRQHMQHLAGRTFELIRLGSSRRRLELESNGRVGSGWSPTVYFWWLQEGTLILAGSDGRLSASLIRAEKDHWQGACLRDNRTQIQLVPAVSSN